MLRRGRDASCARWPYGRSTGAAVCVVIVRRTTTLGIEAWRGGQRRRRPAMLRWRLARVARGVRVMLMVRLWRPLPVRRRLRVRLVVSRRWRRGLRMAVVWWRLLVRRRGVSPSRRAASGRLRVGLPRRGVVRVLRILRGRRVRRVLIRGRLRGGAWRWVARRLLVVRWSCIWCGATSAKGGGVLPLRLLVLVLVLVRRRGGGGWRVACLPEEVVIVVAHRRRSQRRREHALDLEGRDVLSLIARREDDRSAAALNVAGDAVVELLDKREDRLELALRERDAHARRRPRHAERVLVQVRRLTASRCAGGVRRRRRYHRRPRHPARSSRRCGRRGS